MPTIAGIIEKAQQESRSVLYEDESKQILSLSGIPVNLCLAAKSPDEAARLAEQTGFPAVLKVRSSVITHKSDAGGVCLNLADPDAVRRACEDIMERARDVDPGSGVTVQKMAPPGVELIIGMKKDSQFGPVAAFGLGGTMVGVMDDICFGMVPLTENDAMRMIDSIKGKKILDGYRGRPGASRKSLAEILTGISALARSCPQITEIDINPVIAYPDSALAVDARMVISLGNHSQGKQ